VWRVAITSLSHTIQMQASEYYLPQHRGGSSKLDLLIFPCHDIAVLGLEDLAVLVLNVLYAEDAAVLPLVLDTADGVDVGEHVVRDTVLDDDVLFFPVRECAEHKFHDDAGVFQLAMYRRGR